MFWKAFCEGIRQQYLKPEKLAHYARVLVNVVVIVLLAWFVNQLMRRIIRRILYSRGRLIHERRTRTLVALVQSVVGYLVFFVALVMTLRALGIDYTAILAGAGIVGLAVGFGAQTLVRDFISGFFLLFEDLIGVGDWITVGDISGSVEQIGLRVTQVRAYDGALYMIPNGELTRFGNQNRAFSRALVAVDVVRSEDLPLALTAATTAARRWYSENRELALEEPSVQSVVGISEQGLRIRLACRVKPMKHWEAEYGMRSLLVQELHNSGVEFAQIRQMVRLARDNGNIA